jgi:uncharacterized membrane protein
MEGSQAKGSTMSATDTGSITEWPQSLVWAAFDTWYGAADALAALQQQADRPWLIDVENVAIIEKNKDGGVTFNESADRTGASGLGTGALIGGLVGMLFPPAFIASTAAGAAVGGLGAQMRDAGFEDNALRAVANELPAGSSLLLALVTHKWADDLVRALDQLAYKVGWIEVSQQMADRVLASQGRVA